MKNNFGMFFLENIIAFWSLPDKSQERSLQYHYYEMLQPQRLRGKMILASFSGQKNQTKKITIWQTPSV